MTGPPLSLEGRSLRMARTGAVVSVGPRLGEGGQGVVHEAAFGGFGCAVKWYRAVPRPAELRRSISALAERGRPHRAFIWPMDVVVSDEMPGFGVITAHHLRRDRDYDTVVATVEAHPASPGRVVLRNAGTRPWVMRPDGEGRRRWSRAGGWPPAR